MCGVWGLASLRQCLCVPRASIHPASHHRHLNVCVYLGEIHTPFPILVGVRAFLVGGGRGGSRVEGEGVAGMEGKWWWSEMRERGQGEGGWSGEPPVCLVCATFLPSSLPRSSILLFDSRIFSPPSSPASSPPPRGVLLLQVPRAAHW